MRPGVVTTDTPGCREIVHHEVTGLLTAPATSALSGAIERLVADPELRTALGRRGRQLAVDDFALDRVVQDTLATYAALLRG
ncbi:MAG: glycosyltransferase [Vicinamibacterales bacterium]